MNDVYLVDITMSNEGIEEVFEMTRNEKGIREIFYNKTNRVISSCANVLIKEKNTNETVGFINLVDENEDNFLFADIGIKEKYRGNGYSYKAFKELLDILDFSVIIIGETKKSNISANESAKKIGIKIYEKDDRNFYLLNNLEKVDEVLDQLISHVEEYPKRKILRR